MQICLAEFTCHASQTFAKYLLSPSGRFVFIISGKFVSPLIQESYLTSLVCKTEITAALTW